MQATVFTVKNVKCAGCAGNIQEAFTAVEGIDSVEVDIETGTVKISGNAPDSVDLGAKLGELGYPVVD